MPSKKLKNPGHLHDGRHVATVCNDELLLIGANSLFSADRRLATTELVRRKAPKPREYGKGYVSFPSQTRNVDVWVDMHKDMLAAKKAGRPDQPSRVKDARKDKKRNGEGKP